MPFRVPAASACQRVPQIDRFQGVTTAQEGGLCQSFARSGKPFLCNGLCSRRSVAAGMSRTGWVPLTFPEYAGLDGPNAAIASALGVYGLDAIRVRLAGLGGSQTRTRPVLRYHFTCPTRTRRGLGQRHTVLQPRCWQNEKRQTPSASAPTSHIVERNGDTPPSEML